MTLHAYNLPTYPSASGRVNERLFQKEIADISERDKTVGATEIPVPGDCWLGAAEDKQEESGQTVISQGTNL